TLEVGAWEELTNKAAPLWEGSPQTFTAISPRREFLSDVRGKGLMIGIEFGPPQAVKLKALWHTSEAAKAGLFCQLITMPLFKEHKVLSQVASHGSHTIKLLPSLIISVADCEWIVSAFDSVLADSEHIPGAVWSLARSLVSHTVRASA